MHSLRVLRRLVCALKHATSTQAHQEHLLPVTASMTASSTSKQSTECSLHDCSGGEAFIPGQEQGIPLPGERSALCQSYALCQQNRSCHAERRAAGQRRYHRALFRCRSFKSSRLSSPKHIIVLLCCLTLVQYAHQCNCKVASGVLVFTRHLLPRADFEILMAKIQILDAAEAEASQSCKASFSSFSSASASPPYMRRRCLAEDDKEDEGERCLGGRNTSGMATWMSPS